MNIRQHGPLVAALALATFVSVPSISAQGQSPCLGPLNFFDNTWSTGSYTVNGATPQWMMMNDPRWDIACIDDQSNIPAIWHNSCWVGCRRLEFFMKARGDQNDNDTIGFVLGFCDGDETNPNAEYLAVLWNGGTVNAQLPGCAGPGTHPVGMRLVRVFGIPDPQELWSQTDMPCNGPNNGVELLATAQTKGNTPWTRFQPNGFVVDLTRTSLDIYCNGSLEFSLQQDFERFTEGCFGYLSQGQYADFWNLTSTAINPVAANWNNYGVGTPGCNGVPTLTMLNLPRNGSSPEIAIGNAGTQPHTGAMVWSIAPDNRFEPFLGGNLLVLSPFAAVTTQTVNPGGFVFSCTIEDDSCQNGQEFYLQWICPDTCAPSGWALSRGLRLQLGDL